MKRLLLLALTTLPLVACAGAVDETDEMADELTEETATASEALTLPAVDALVDFDEILKSTVFPSLGSTIVAANSIVDNSYAGYGVTFSCVSCSSGHAFARPISSGSNGVTLIDPAVSVLPFFDSRSGALKAEFATPKSWVSIDARPLLAPEYKGTPVGMPWLEAYDVNGTLLMKTLYPLAYGQAGWGTPMTLTVSASSATIKYVRFSSRWVVYTPPVYGEFDNLRFNGEPIVVTPIEKPIRPRFVTISL